ncbi:DUF309 domain-containing protein [Paenisporosarcina cavernae]|uniref:DUF309 domain-containing protein n=1 Tax=Paenisporosarcina cavernae TaxID=2320858 RepID=A0A385YS87_9BACL|nr:DUF309 domain-containing protein [Paenisporosarcina cavernae]AYC29351.1 DUF309 domain-containing protein [Paenisporosarcina cavernae]
MHPLFHPLFLQYIHYYNLHQDFFECHEVLEEYWKDVAPKERDHPLVGYILLATGMYHWRRKNYRGANRSFKKALSRLPKEHLFLEYMDQVTLKQNILVALRHTENENDFLFSPLPVKEPLLTSAISYPMPPSQEEEYLLHKHLLRDRKDIVQQREKALKENKKKRRKAKSNADKKNNDTIKD